MSHRVHDEACSHLGVAASAHACHHTLPEMRGLNTAGEEVPSVSLQRTPVEKLMHMFSREDAGVGGDAGSGDDGEGSKGGWSTWMGIVFVCLALVNFLSSQASTGSQQQQQRASSQGRQGASAGQQRARESTPAPDAGAGGRRRTSADAGGGNRPDSSSAHSSSRSAGAAGGSARGAQDEGPRQRPAAAAGAGSATDDLRSRLGNCTVLALPRSSLSSSTCPPARRALPQPRSPRTCRTSLHLCLGTCYSVPCPSW